jgi:hypothetical protein
MLRAFFYKQWHKGVGVAHDWVLTP